MWRAMFLAIGVYLMILGAECLAVEKVNLKTRQPARAAMSPFDTEPKAGAPKEIKPPTWAPWSLMASGAVVCLYSFTLPRRVKGE